MKIRVFDATKGVVTDFTEKEREEGVAYGNACRGKMQHKTLLSAQYYLEELQKNTDKKVEIYKCRVCKFYHIGRVGKDKRKKNK